MDSSFILTIVIASIGGFLLQVAIFFLLYKKFRFHQENNTIASSISSSPPPSSLSLSYPPSSPSSSSPPSSLSPPSSPSSSSPPSSLSLSYPQSSFPHNNWEHNVFPSFHGADVRKAFLSHILKELRSKGINPFIDNAIERSKSIGPELIGAIRGSRIAIVLLSRNYASSTWCLNELVEIMKCREELRQIVMTIFYEVDPTDVKKQSGEFGNVFRKTCKGKSDEDIRRWRHALAEVAKIAGYHSQNWDNEAEMIEAITRDISNKLFHSTPSRDFDHLVGMEAHMEKMEQLLRLDLDEVRVIGILGPAGIGKTTIARFLYDRHSKDFQLSVFMENIKRYAIPVCSDNYGVKKNLQEQFMSQIINQPGIKIPHLGTVQNRLKDKKVFVVLDDVDQLVQIEAMAKETCWFGPWSRIIITTQDQSLLRACGINHTYKVDFPSSGEALEMFCTYAFGQKYPKDGFKKLAGEVTYLTGKLPLGLQVMGSYFRGKNKEEWSLELPRLRTRLDEKIESILKFSYDALCDEDKDLFLHLACFFNFEVVEKVVEYLAKSFKHVRQRLDILAEKSLISFNGDWLIMHSLLVQLGKEVVRKQSVREPGQRQFLVEKEDIHEVFTDYTDQNTKSVIGINSFYWSKLNVSERVFEGMTNLQFLRFRKGLSCSGCLSYISPKLRLLHWDHSPMTCLPFIDNLVELRMEHSKLEKLWDGVKPLGNLKWINLGYSENLKELPSSIGNAANLQELDLRDCSSLVELPFSIGNATNLQVLNLDGCKSLVELPSSIGNLHRLMELRLQGCSKLEFLPSKVNLVSLTFVNLSYCSSLKRFPEISTNIEYLNLVGTSIEEVPWSIMSWSSLQELHMSYSENLKKFPYALPRITQLYLNDTEIQQIGPWVKSCSRLHRLVLAFMQKLVSVSELPDSLMFLDAEGCESLERLDCSSSNPDVRLNFRKCFKLNQEARNLIVETSTCELVVLPGGEVPAYFTLRFSGISLTVKLNEKPLPTTSTKFRVCVAIASESEYKEGLDLKCRIMSARGTMTQYEYFRGPFFSEHLYIFNIEVKYNTSTELDFVFELATQGNNIWIKECGIRQLSELHVDGRAPEMRELQTKTSEIRES